MAFLCADFAAFVNLENVGGCHAAQCAVAVSHKPESNSHSFQPHLVIRSRVTGQYVGCDKTAARKGTCAHFANALSVAKQTQPLPGLRNWIE